ncbi:MAG: putative signal transduction response regulator, receiver domain protein, partial [Nitrososphaeraceae archaeon]|nr:putative signal transduction response regulator, receiver domain protein [Nitrososphaeraceae archaeon]
YLNTINTTITMGLDRSSIVVVDDESDLVFMFKVTLEMNGYNVIGFTNPVEALEYLKKNHDKCTLVITDYKMPEINGCELATKIEEIDEKIKVIIITAYENIIEDTSDFEVIKKPISTIKLLELVANNVNLK